MLNKNELILKTLHKMDNRIRAGVKATSSQEQEDLTQDIYTRFVHVVYDMEVITFWGFKKKVEAKQ